MKQIHNCPQLFANQCPKSWQELQPTQDDRRRYCSTCENSVYECRTPDEFVSLGLEGKCVSLPDHVHEQLCGPQPDGLPLPMGFPSKEGLERMRDCLELQEAWLNAAERVSRESR
jgi:hypothetical protein